MMRSGRRGRVITLLMPACAAITLGGCAVGNHLPRWMPFARAEQDSAAADATVAGAHGDVAGPLAFAAARITAETVRSRVGSLAGSGPAAYLAAELHALGLEPAGDSGTFIQRLPADRVAARMAGAGAAGDAAEGDDSDRSDAPRSAQSAAANAASHPSPQRGEAGRGVGVSPPISLRATGAQGSSLPVFGRDYFVHSMPVTSASAPLVWAGVAAPGRRAPGPEAAGRALAFFLPGEAPDKAWHAALSTTVQGSIDAGATAVLLVLDPEFSDAMVEMLAAEPGGDAVPAMVVGLRYDAAVRIFRNGLRDLDQLRDGPNQLVPVTGTTITWDAAGAGVGYDAPDDGPRNVIAILPGSDSVLKDTYVVFSAPIQQPGAEVVAGTDVVAGTEAISPSPSASSAATLLEVAAAFASLPERPARSLIFLGAAGNGADRPGSKHFAASPPVPAVRIVASIGIDGLVHGVTDTIAAIGEHYTSMGPLVRPIADAHPELNLVLAPDLSPEDDGFLRGDSFDFARIGVPAISFTARPPRDASGAANAPESAAAPRSAATIGADDADSLARVAQFIFYFGHALASRAERPIWTAEGRAAVQKNE